MHLQIAKDTLVRDLFISGVASAEAERLLFQESNELTSERCLTLVTSFESVIFEFFSSREKTSDSTRCDCFAYS